MPDAILRCSLFKPLSSSGEICIFASFTITGELDFGANFLEEHQIEHSDNIHTGIQHINRNGNAEILQLSLLCGIL